MKIKNILEPQKLEYVVIEDGEIAILEFHENVVPCEDSSGWMSDCYTLICIHSMELIERMKTEYEKWLEYAKTAEVKVRGDRG